MDPPSQQAASQSAGPFPRLEVLDPAKPHTFITPTKQINDGPDVARFLTSKAYRDIGAFVMQLNRALCPRKRDGGPSKTFLLGVKHQESETIRKLQQLLEKAGSFIEEAPPDPGPRRFGNVSFRTWYKLLEDRTAGLLKEYLPREVLEFPTARQDEAADGDSTQGEGPIDELKAYFLGAFGSAQRLDYGTGHELSFLAFLGCLWKLGAFNNGSENGEIERSIVLDVFEPYLKVIRRLILTYTLEPAGSHGVWGLDDHSFMPYIFGSAQLTRPINESEAMPLEGSVERAPKPSDVTKLASVERFREVNMYFSAIGFINDVKKGPFWEHSPILFDVSGIKDGWGKINKGMIKMFNAEVLSKFPVVQHFPFGSLFSWDQDPNAATPQQTIHMANQPTAMPGPAGGAGTAAPWAQATQMPGSTGPGIPYSRAPWASSGTGSNAPSMTARPPPPAQPTGPPGTAGAQITVTRAPWARGEPGNR